METSIVEIRKDFSPMKSRITTATADIKGDKASRIMLEKLDQMELLLKQKGF